MQTSSDYQQTQLYNIDTHYTLYGYTKQKVTNAKYLGITFDCHLNRKSHINITTKANAAQAFLWRNTTFYPTEVKIHCYNTFVWPIMKYSASVWWPHTIQDIPKLEKVQRRAARYIFNDYSSFHSASIMLNQLNWPSLDTRRDYTWRLPCFKIIEGLVDITPIPDLTPVLSIIRGHSYRLYITPSQINCHLFSFIPTATKLWNSLPSHAYSGNLFSGSVQDTTYYLNAWTWIKYWTWHYI